MSDRIKSYSIKGRHLVYYYPDINVLSLDGGNSAYLSVSQEFKDTVLAFFLGPRKLLAVKEAQQPSETLFVEPRRTCNLACTTLNRNYELPPRAETAPRGKARPLTLPPATFAAAICNGSYASTPVIRSLAIHRVGSNRSG